MDNPASEDNPLLHNCLIHGAPCDTYCINCMQIRCAQCPDQHKPNKCILNAHQIYCILLRLTNPKDMPIVIEERKALTPLIDKAIVLLPTWFAQLVNQIDSDIEYVSYFDVALADIDVDKMWNLKQQLNSKPLIESIEIRLKNAKRNLRAVTIVLKKIMIYIECPTVGIVNDQQTLNYDLLAMPQKVAIYVNNMKKFQILRQYIVANYNAFTTNRNPLLLDIPSVHYFSDSYITIYKVFNKQKASIQLNKSINPYADSISYGRGIFVIGGGVINDVYEIEIPRGVFITRQPMNTKKYSHTLCSANGYIYSVGGYNGTLRLGDCERYHVIHDKWEQLPDLLKARDCSAAFTLNKRFLYCFCGTTNSGSTNVMEKLKIGESSWEYVKVKMPITPRWGIHGIQLSNRQAIVFGSNTTDNSYVLTMSEGGIECARNANLIEGSNFYHSSAAVVVNWRVYAVDSYHRVHSYGNGRWEMVKLQPQI